MNIKDNTRFFIISSIIIAVMPFLAYFTILKCFFHGGDFVMIYLGYLGKLSDVFRLFIPCSQDVAIRPVGDITWFLDYRLWGLNPLGYRLANIALHSINSILVLLLSFFLLKDKIISLGAALLFAIQPIHSTALSHISYRYDLLSTLFYLLSLVSFALYVYKPGQRFFYYLSIIAYPLALFSKEMAITLPLAIILYGSFLEERFSLSSIINRINRYTPYITITIIYLTWRLAFTGSVGGLIDPTTAKSVFLNINLLNYLSKAGYAIPVEFLIHLNRAVFSHDAINLINTVLISGVVVAIVLSFKEILKHLWVMLFSFLWIALTLIPVHNLVDFSGIFLTPRVYLPSVGFCIALSTVILLAKASVVKRYVSLGIFIVFCVLYIFITIGNNSIWFTPGEINRSIPRIVNEYYKRYGSNIKYYFWVPDRSNDVCVFANELPYVLAPLFAPVNPDSVVILGDGHFTDPAYRGNDVDLRQPDTLENLGKKIFFFQYAQDEADFKDLSLLIKTNLTKRLVSSKTSKTTMPALSLSGPVDAVYTSQSLHIPAYLIGGLEVRMRVKYRDYQLPASISSPYREGNIIWHKDNNSDWLEKAFPIEMDGEYHTYQIPFTIYKADWAEDSYVAKIEFSAKDILSEVDLDYIKLLPYER